LFDPKNNISNWQQYLDNEEMMNNQKVVMVRIWRVFSWNWKLYVNNQFEWYRASNTFI